MLDSDSGNWRDYLKSSPSEDAVECPAGQPAGVGAEQGDEAERNQNVGAGQTQNIEANDQVDGDGQNPNVQESTRAPALNADAGMQNLNLEELMYPAPPSMYGTSKVLLAQGFPPFCFN